jgi:hypothetical protein
MGRVTVCLVGWERSFRKVEKTIGKECQRLPEIRYVLHNQLLVPVWLRGHHGARLGHSPVSHLGGNLSKLPHFSVSSPGK